MTGKAVIRLQPSRLLDQRQLMINDIELASLNLALKGKASVSVVEAVVDGEITRTIEGASTVTFTIFDRDREILNSGRLTAKTDIKLDGLWFRLTGITKNGDELTLTFEDREVAILRLYKTPLLVARSKLSRSRFIKKMINEVKELKIPFVCPEIDKLPPVRLIAFDSGARGQTQYERNPGFAPWTVPGGGQGFIGDLTVRGLPATPEQIENTDKVLQVGASRGASWSCMVAAVMVINEETNARNVDHSGDGLSAGLFQQIYEPHQYAWGTKAQVMDIAWSSNRFFDGAIRAYNANPSIQPEYIALAAQVAGNQEDRIIPIWRRFRAEAERTVGRWGVPKNAADSGLAAKSTIEQRQAQEAANLQASSAGDQAVALVSATGGQDFAALQADSANYQFSRGVMSIIDGQKKLKPENSWECSGRLAEEINWRRFMVSGTFYLMSEPYLFRSKPVMKLNEDTPGVISIDGDYTIGTKNASATVTCHLGRWEAPPGSMIELFRVGPISGRWLVSEVTRNLFDTTMDIKLKKPRPILAEPNLDQEKGLTYSLVDQQTFPTATGVGLGSDNTPVPVDLGEALTEVRALINSGRITFDHANDRAGLMLSGSVRRTDGQLVQIDPAVIRFMVWAGDRYGIRVSSMIGSHPQFVAGSNNSRESRHWTGHALDIGSILSGGQDSRVDQASSKTSVVSFMRAVGALAPGLLPNQQICNGCGHEDPEVQALQLDNGIPKGGHWVSDHVDHIHIGF